MIYNNQNFYLMKKNIIENFGEGTKCDPSKGDQACDAEDSKTFNCVYSNQKKHHCLLKADRFFF